MSLEYAILGFLNYGPSSGYDLKKYFDMSIQHFWHADQSQIYRTLNRLMQQELVKVDVVHQETRPDRKIYHITPAGKEDLQRWLKTSLPPEQERSALLIQVFFAAQVDDEQALAHFRNYAQEMRNLLEVYQQIIQHNVDAPHAGFSKRDVFFWVLTLECGVVNAQAQLAWAESVIARLEKKQYSSTLKKK